MLLRQEVNLPPTKGIYSFASGSSQRLNQNTPDELKDLPHLVIQPKGKLTIDKPDIHPYGTQSKTQRANTEIVTVTNSVNFNDSISTGFGSHTGSLFEVAKGAHLAVKHLQRTS